MYASCVGERFEDDDVSMGVEKEMSRTSLEKESTYLHYYTKNL